MIEIELPLRTVSEANVRCHWAERSRRVKKHRTLTALRLRAPLWNHRLPAVVVLTRLAPSKGLDDDNLRSALKAVRDGIADALQVDDGDPRVQWHYRQERGPARRYGVRIRVMVAEQETGT
jgi:hypothetical protein